MANKGANTNSSQFYFTFKATPHLDKKHTVFGKLVGGEDVLDALEKLPVKPGSDRPAKTVRISEVVIYQDPFEEYKKRLANKLAKRAEAEKATDGQAVTKEKPKDDINWFGVKVGSVNPTPSSEKTGGASVGKYLLKRSQDATEGSVTGEPKKKRKVGFGDFAGW